MKFNHLIFILLMLATLGCSNNQGERKPPENKSNIPESYLGNYEIKEIDYLPNKTDTLGSYFIKISLSNRLAKFQKSGEVSSGSRYDYICIAIHNYENLGDGWKIYGEGDDKIIYLNGFQRDTQTLLNGTLEYKDGAFTSNLILSGKMRTEEIIDEKMSEFVYTPYTIARKGIWHLK